MKFSPVAAIFLAALANAQSADIPSCAKPCLDDAVKKNTQCSVTDYSCICKSFSAIEGAATSCVLKECGQKIAIEKVLPATQALCKEGGSSGGSGGSSNGGHSSAAASSAPASSAASSAAASSQQPQQSSAAGHSGHTAAPTQPPQTTGAGHHSVDCTSTMKPTGKPSTNGTAPTSSVVTAGASGLAPIGCFAMLGLGALLL